MIDSDPEWTSERPLEEGRPLSALPKSDRPRFDQPVSRRCLLFLAIPKLGESFLEADEFGLSSDSGTRENTTGVVAMMGPNPAQEEECELGTGEY